MAKPILFATDVIKAAGRGEPEAIAALQQAEERALPAISVLTEITLVKECKEEAEYDRLLKFTSRFDVLSLNRKISHKSIEIRRQYSDLGSADFLIAATAVVHGMSLVTKRRAHFSRIDSLSVESYPNPFS
jgi:predicted nucleic acid-binding protein